MCKFLHHLGLWFATKTGFGKEENVLVPGTEKYIQVKSIYSSDLKGLGVPGLKRRHPVLVSPMFCLCLQPELFALPGRFPSEMLETAASSTKLTSYQCGNLQKQRKPLSFF